ncbi:MAG: polysaccharide biosynthesis/export family protein [Limisphaerales bacterium]
MNLVSKLTLFSCAALLAGTVLSGCGKTDDPVLSDNPTPPATTGMGTGAVTNDVSPIPAPAARFQSGETVSISSSTGSQMVDGPIPSIPQSYLIADDGTITLPLIGVVQAAGKTPGELQRIITRLYVPRYFVRLAVSVTAMNRVYYVGGEVTKPGPEEYLGHTTVSRAIQAAGDFTVFASHNVTLIRSDGTHLSVNVDQALKDADNDPPVYPGDQIQVPRRRF